MLVVKMTLNDKRYKACFIIGGHCNEQKHYLAQTTKTVQQEIVRLLLSIK